MSKLCAHASPTATCLLHMEFAGANARAGTKVNALRGIRTLAMFMFMLMIMARARAIAVGSARNIIYRSRQRDSKLSEATGVTKISTGDGRALIASCAWVTADSNIAACRKKGHA